MPLEKEDCNEPGDSQKLESLEKATTLFPVSQTILFSVLGVFARLCLFTLPFFPGSSNFFSELWANAVGTAIAGFALGEAGLKKEEIASTLDLETQKSKSGVEVDVAQPRKAHGAFDEPNPLYIGITAGFSGSLTSFSSLIQDVFLAISNDVSTPLQHHTPTPSIFIRIFSALPVILITASICIRSLDMGMHLAQALRHSKAVPVLQSRSRPTKPLLNHFILLTALAAWTAPAFLFLFAPSPSWPSPTLLAMLLAPLSALARFYISTSLKLRFPTFPLGTFVVNVLGTMILGIQLSYGDGWMGGCNSCFDITSMSAWVIELRSLQRGHAWIYGIGSGVATLAAFALATSIIPRLR